MSYVPMRVEVASVSVSKKKTVWVQVKLLEGEMPRTGEIFDCRRESCDCDLQNGEGHVKGCYHGKRE